MFLKHKVVFVPWLWRVGNQSYAWLLFIGFRKTSEWAFLPLFFSCVCYGRSWRKLLTNIKATREERQNKNQVINKNRPILT